LRFALSANAAGTAHEPRAQEHERARAFQRTSQPRVVLQARALHFIRRVRPALLTLALIGVAACGSCYHLPSWKGDVHVTPLERKAIKKCGAGNLTPAGTERISREPYLQSTTTTSATVVWGSRDARGEVVITEPGGDVVKRVTARYAGDPNKEARRRAAQRPGKQPLPAEDIYLVAAALDQLEPTHLYCYQLFVGGVALTEPAPMNTAAAPGIEEPVHFVAVGDIGTGGPAQEAILKRMTESPFEFILVLGDLAYKSGKPSQLHGNFFAVYENVLRYVPVYPSIGNHERRTKQGKPYFDAFVLPHPERYYSFEWGDIHFVAIDTTQYDTDQLAWLVDDLRKNQRRWVIVFGHHPMYTNSLRGAQLSIRKAFSKIFTDHQVDLVVTGHEHQYERFRVGGVNYVVSGGGGGPLTRFFGDSRALKQATVHHYLAFEVTAKSLTMKAIDINGREIESLKLEKKGPIEKVKVDGKPDPRATPIPPEDEVKPNEKLHDGPDDDTKRQKVPPPPTEPTPIEVKPPTSANR
jgi:predicted phosphodiesterase